MKIVAINTFNIGSTGKIMLQIADKAREEGVEYYTACPRARDNYKKKVPNQIFIGNRFLRNIHGVLSKITGFEGWFSILSTLNFLFKIERINPDIIHLHNIHGSYLNFILLFFYIKWKKIKVVWTLHDCWPFTGRCPYFTIIKCEEWINNCYSCCYPKNEYPYSFIDSTRICYKIKRWAFSNLNDMTIVTPSFWLSELVKKSFLKVYPVKVINNGIDLDVFRPYKSDFRKMHNIKEDDIMILGVAFNWDSRKGIDVFVQLSKLLARHYKIVLVGINENIEKDIPSSIIKIKRTENQVELAEIYTAADVFVNPTREENFPTVNIEALACGTPVVTFRTGGSAEIIDSHSGISVEQDDMEGLVKAIKEICERKSINTEKCLARSKCFDQNERFREYIDLYQNVADSI